MFSLNKVALRPTPVRGRLHADEMSQWLEMLPADKPSETARWLGLEARYIARTNMTIRRRLKLLELITGRSRSVLQQIDDSLRAAPLPLSSALHRDAIGADRLLKTLGAAYADLAQDIVGRWMGFGLTTSLRLTILRGMQIQVQRLLFAYRAYRHGSRTAWTMLHRLYTTALAAGIEKTMLESETETPVQIYMQSLLLAFAEPTKHSPHGLDRLLEYLERHAELAHFVPVQLTAPNEQRPATFLVRPSDPQTGRPIRTAAGLLLQPGDMLLDCSRLVEKLKFQIAGLELHVSPENLKLPDEAAEPEYLSMLRTLQSLWSTPPARRYGRKRFRPRVDMVVGFGGIWGYLAHPRHNGQSPSPTPTQEGMSHWSVLNESPAGLALRYVGGDTRHLRVGELCGVRRREHGTLFVCIARRALSGTLNELELGAEELSPGAAPVTITFACPEAGSLRREKAILLPRMPALGGALGLVLAPTGMLPGTEIRLHDSLQDTRLRISRKVEKTASCEIFALESSVAHRPH